MKKGKRGFTLLEILIVIIIIGILATLAVPQYFRTIERARQSEAISNLGLLRGAMERSWMAMASPTFVGLTLDTLDIDNPNDNANNLYNYSITVQTADNFTLEAVRNAFRNNQNITCTVDMNRAGDLTVTWGTPATPPAQQ